MDEKELRDIIEASNDRMKLFKDINMLAKCNLTAKNFISLVNDFLSDEQKYELTESEIFTRLNNHSKSMIIESISDEKIKLRLLSKVSLMSKLPENYVNNIIMSLGDIGKVTVLTSLDILKNYNVDIAKIFSSLFSVK